MAGGGSLGSGDRRLARADVMVRAARAAAGFAETGAGPGGAIAVLMRNDIPFVEAVFAAGFVGAQAVPINWHYKREEIAYILEDSGATHLVAHTDLLVDIAGALDPELRVLAVPTPPEIAEAYGVDPRLAEPPDGDARWESWDGWVGDHPPLPPARRGSGGTMMYTSGTTGRPKGVRREPVSDARRGADNELRQRWFGNRPGLRTAIVGPMYHSVQLSYTTAAVQAPGDVILVPRFDPEGLLRLVEQERLTHLHLVPIMMSRLMKLPPAVRDRYDLSSLEFVVHGSAPCPPDVKREVIEWLGPIVHEYYGTTETGMVSRVSSEEWLERPGTVGRPWPGREVRIYDEDGRPLPPGAPGDVYMSLGSMPDFTYHRADDARAEIEREGLVTGGDVGYLDDDGYLFLCDRRRDMVISGGVNIYPAEVEGVLTSHEAVLDAAVFGVPDDEYGESVMAVVQLRDRSAATPEELQRHVRERIASFKVPRRVEIRDALPRDASGKIAKRRLREPYWQQAGRRI